MGVWSRGRNAGLASLPALAPGQVTAGGPGAGHQAADHQGGGRAHDPGQVTLAPF